MAIGFMRAQCEDCEGEELLEVMQGRVLCSQVTLSTDWKMREYRNRKCRQSNCLQHFIRNSLYGPLVYGGISGKVSKVSGKTNAYFFKAIFILTVDLLTMRSKHVSAWGVWGKLFFLDRAELAEFQCLIVDMRERS